MIALTIYPFTNLIESGFNSSQLSMYNLYKYFQLYQIIQLEVFFTNFVPANAINDERTVAKITYKSTFAST